MPDDVADENSAQSSSAIRVQLQKILNSSEFENADRLKRLLAFVVEETLAGKTAQIN